MAVFVRRLTCLAAAPLPQGVLLLVLCVGTAIHFTLGPLFGLWQVRSAPPAMQALHVAQRRHSINWSGDFGSCHTSEPYATSCCSAKTADDGALLPEETPLPLPVVLAHIPQASSIHRLLTSDTPCSLSLLCSRTC